MFTAAKNGRCDPYNKYARISVKGDFVAGFAADIVAIFDGHLPLIQILGRSHAAHGPHLLYCSLH